MHFSVFYGISMEKDRELLATNQIDFQSAFIDLYLEKIISWDEPS